MKWLANLEQMEDIMTKSQSGIDAGSAAARELLTAPLARSPELR